MEFLEMSETRGWLGIVQYYEETCTWKKERVRRSKRERRVSLSQVRMVEKREMVC